MYFTRFGYFVIFSVIGVAVAAVLLIAWPFGSDADGGGDGSTVAATATMPIETPQPTIETTPALSFEQVVNFARAGAVVDIIVTSEVILVNLNPAFDTSGLGTDSHAFTTALPPGQNSVEEALRQNGIAVGGDDGVPVIRQ
jgi:predicted permease